MLKETARASAMNKGVSRRIDVLYQRYVFTANGDMARLHKIILDQFVNNPYIRNSNQEIDYIWSLYKKEK